MSDWQLGADLSGWLEVALAMLVLMWLGTVLRWVAHITGFERWLNRTFPMKPSKLGHGVDLLRAQGYTRRRAILSAQTHVTVHPKETSKP